MRSCYTIEGYELIAGKGTENLQRLIIKADLYGQLLVFMVRMAEAAGCRYDASCGCILLIRTGVQVWWLYG
jgi:hypothetical protein